MSWTIFGLVLFLPWDVRGTLTPNGMVRLDCGSQRDFTCDVSDITTGVALAGWRIDRLFNITAPGGINGLRVANDNIRVTTTTGGNVPRSTITIANFDMRDNGGTVQCINTDDSTIQGTATISVGTPPCPTNCTRSRNEDFTTVSVSCQQPPNTPPVTSTTVTYCPTSSLDCGNSMNCTTSPCNISGLNACEDYQLTVVPNNNCGSPTGCTGNSVMSKGQDVPLCASDVQASNILASNICSVSLTWQQTPNTHPVTSTTVTYCSTSSPNCGNVTCTSPCTISGLLNNTEYQFTVIPNNNCGSPTGCTGNSATVMTFDSCTASYLQPSEGLSIDAACRTSLGIGVAVPIAVLIVVNIITGVVVFLITRHCYKKTSQNSSPSKGGDVYEQVERQKSYDDIMMTDSPAYGPVK